MLLVDGDWANGGLGVEDGVAVGVVVDGEDTAVSVREARFNISLSLILK